jgi:uncharacterized protein (TIGR03437 family)
MTIRHAFITLSTAVLCLSTAWGQQYIISTVAGNGAAGFTGDGGPAASAQLSSPARMFLDSSGNLYFADTVNQRVRKISNGTISTVAGNGTAGYGGDKGAATSANLFNPSGVAVDSSGNIYIADTSNHVVRQVSGSNITTFAGNHSGGYSGDGGLAINAQLAFPTAVAVDSSGNVYIADSGNNVIRKVVGGTITTIDAIQPLHHPNDLVLDTAGNLYIADTEGRRILKFSGGVLSVVAGDGSIGFSGDNGPATDATFDDPVGLALDSAGYFYVADTFNSRIRKISPAGIITTIAGNGAPNYGGNGGPATAAYLYFPRSVVADPSGKVYIADTGSNTIRLLQIVPPAIAAKGVVNAASFTPQVSPGSLASIFGSNFTGTGLQASAALPLPDSLGGVSVKVNGKSAPLLYVNSNQVNFQIPWATATGSASISLSVNGVGSNAVNVPVLAAAPGLFSFSSGRAIVQNQDLTLNSPSHPAKVGSTITAYLTGSGAVSPAVTDGAPAPSSPLSKVTASSSAAIGSVSAQVSFAGLAPGFVGLLQVNIVVPASLAQGDYPLAVTIGGQASNAATISVAP